MHPARSMTVTPVTVVVPHFAREIRTDRDRYRQTDTASRVTSHFVCAAAQLATDDRLRRFKCGGGYRVIRKRVTD